MTHQHLTKKIAPALAVLALAVSTACSAQKPAQADEQPTEQPAVAANEVVAPKEEVGNVGLQYQQMREMAALDDRCNWLEPIARTALDASIAERQATYLHLGGSNDELQAAADKLVQPRKTYDCNEPGAADFQDALHTMTWQMRVTWVMRGHALAQKADGRIAAALAPFAESLNTTYATLDATYKVGDNLGLFTAEVDRAIEANARSGAPEGQDQLATTWTDQVLRFAEQLHGTEDKVGTMQRAK